MKELLDKLNLDEAIYNQILAKYDEDINKINSDLETANKNLELKNIELIEVNKNIKNLQKLEPEKIKEELESTKTKMKELEQLHEKELKNVKIDNAINTSLLKNGAINNKAVLPFINKDLINIDEKGSVVGLDEQLKNIMESNETNFLFKAREQQSIKGLNFESSTNAKPGNGLGSPIENNYANMNKFALGKIPSYDMFEQQINNQ